MFSNDRLLKKLNEQGRNKSLVTKEKQPHSICVHNVRHSLYCFRHKFLRFVHLQLLRFCLQGTFSKGQNASVFTDLEIGVSHANHHIWKSKNRSLKSLKSYFSDKKSALDLILTVIFQFG